MRARERNEEVLAMSYYIEEKNKMKEANFVTLLGSN